MNKNQEKKGNIQGGINNGNLNQYSTAFGFGNAIIFEESSHFIWSPAWIEPVLPENKLDDKLFQV